MVRRLNLNIKHSMIKMHDEKGYMAEVDRVVNSINTICCIYSYIYDKIVKIDQMQIIMISVV